MQNYNGNGSRASRARGFIALFATMLAMGLALAASRAEAQPFAYVTNSFSNTVSVIDTATNKVVATVPVGGSPRGIAVAPDAKHAYVAVTNNNFPPSGSVAVIEAATNTVTATVTVGLNPQEVAVTTDGKHAYVTNSDGSVSVIDTLSNTAVATILVGFPTGRPSGLALTPDGKHAYVTDGSFISPDTVFVIDTTSNTVAATIASPLLSGPASLSITPDGKHVYVANNASVNVSVIDTATNTVGTSVFVGLFPLEVAVTPDGKRAYVSFESTSNVSVIDTASNTVVASVPVGGLGIAFTPDGKHAYVTNGGPGTVSVVDTATNAVTATVPVGNAPVRVAIVPPPVGVPFLAFNAKLQIDLDRASKEGGFAIESSFTLSSTAPTINPVTQAVTLQIGTLTTTIPPGSFKKIGGLFFFVGAINGVRLEALIAPTGTLRYAFLAAANEVSLAGTTNPVPVMLTIGGDSGMTSVKALIF